MTDRTVTVRTNTQGATWYAEGPDGTRKGFFAGEGLEHPKRHLAETEAREIATRLGCRAAVIPVVGGPQYL